MWSRPTGIPFFVILAVSHAPLACSSSTPSPATDGGTDGALEAPAAMTLGLAGTVRDKAGVVVAGAKLEVGSTSVFSDTEGKYTLPVAQPGAAVLKVTRNWFKPSEQTVTVGASGTTTHDLIIEEIPLKLDPADATLAQTYAKTFDWTKQTISIGIAARPTRRDFDNAVYFRNPALYRDASNEPALTPAPAPTIAVDGAKNFTFSLKSGANAGQEALDLASVVDTLSATGLSAADQAAFMIWTPMLTWLGEWDAAKAADLKAAGVAVRQQNWGGNSTRPQDIERVYLDNASGTLWVEVVFASFVQIGPGITDSDGDGRKEIFAKLARIHYTKEAVDKLAHEYGTTTFTTHGFSKEVSKSLNELYSSTAAQVEKLIGQPFDVPGLGTINYPFVVLRHTGGQKNVILVAP